MSLRQLFRPKPVLSDADVAQGLRMWTLEGITSMGFGSITSSGFLAAFALALGANNLQIGVLAALPFITQPLQIAFIPLVESLKRRKAISVVTWAGAQLLWLPIALLPALFATPSTAAALGLLAFMGVRGVLTAATNCAWNGWIRDLIPREAMGRLFSRRLAMANLVAAGFGLTAALFVDYWRQRASPEDAVFGYTFVILLGALTLGLASPAVMARMPEPLMQLPPGPKPSLWQTLSAPIRDPRFGRLLRFLFTWGFALNLAVPFFAVYMLQRIHLPLSAVIGFATLAQLANVVFLRLWGPLADRFGSKVVLSLSASLYLLVVLGWAFTTMPERYALTIPLLVVLHVFAGAAAAGATLAVGTIGLKLAPPGQATAYLACASLATSLGAGLGPLAGGLFADFFSVRKLTVDLIWTDPSRVLQVPALSLTGYDFLFGLTFVLGLLTLNTLAAIREEGEVGKEVVLDELLAQTREASRAVSSVPGLRFVSQFPFSYVRYVPGLDVALGLTAYQVASATRAAATGTAQAHKTVATISGRVLQAMARMLERAGELGDVGGDFARQATRGAVHAFDELAEDMGTVVKESVTGVLRGLGRTPVGVEDALMGAGHGAVEGVSEIGGDVGAIAAEVIEGARAAAADLGVTEDQAAVQAARGLLAGAEALGPQYLARVRAALPRDVAERAAAAAEGGEEQGGGTTSSP